MIRVADVFDAQISEYRKVLDEVAKERQFLFFSEAPSVEVFAAITRQCRGNNGVCLVATHNEEVVGWCDIARHASLLSHGGQLSIGLLAPYRGKGIGHKLMTAAMSKAWACGFKRVELAVFARNERALALYEKFGFVREGTLRDAAYLDGVYLDVIWMGALHRTMTSD